jgi:glycosyltransferase involved in cell wall biosynthesis
VERVSTFPAPASDRNGLDFSIVIPTYGRHASLLTCLESLTLLDYARGRFEVIVVSDGEGNPPSAIVESFRDRLPVRLLRQPHAGPATARNTGAAAARGACLVFTDDDCAPAADWLKVLEGHLANDAERAIAGPTRNALPSNVYADATQVLLDYLSDYYNGDRDQPRFWTSNNLAVPASRFRAIGGFDATFPLAAAEDRELNDRWRRLGFRATYCASALVDHAPDLDFLGFCRLHFRYGRGAFHLYRARSRVPEYRFKVEPPSFYLGMLARPLARPLRRGLALSALLFLSQAVHAAGFFSERRAQRIRGRPGG